MNINLIKLITNSHPLRGKGKLMKQFKIKYIRYIIPPEYKSTFNFRKALRIIYTWKKIKTSQYGIDFIRLELKMAT
jgi:hypothetical protein